MSKISLITPTGLRPEAFALCERWMQKQTISWTDWLVVDDYPKEPTKLTCNQLRILPLTEWHQNYNTQRDNMKQLLKNVKGDFIFIIEDDEYYAPDYLEKMVELLKDYDVVGLSNSKYYHLKVKGFKYMSNFTHASLCHTAITKKALPLLYKAVHSGHYYFDIELWKYAHEEHIKSCLIADTNLAIGIKGMPGRAGLGAGHIEGGYRMDSDLTTFKTWLGEDSRFYLPFIGK